MSDDDLLASLPAIDPGPRHDREVERRAHAILARERAIQTRPVLGKLVRLYDRAIEPTFMIAVALVHLAWTAMTVLSLIR